MRFRLFRKIGLSRKRKPREERRSGFDRRRRKDVLLDFIVDKSGEKHHASLGWKFIRKEDYSKLAAPLPKRKETVLPSDYFRVRNRRIHFTDSFTTAPNPDRRKGTR